MFASLVCTLIFSYVLWPALACSEPSQYDGTWKGDKMGVFINMIIEGGTLKSIDAEYLFTNQKKCLREEATFSDGFKGSHTFSQMIPDGVRKDVTIKGNSFVWNLFPFLRQELIVKGKFTDENIVRGAIVSKCPSYTLSWIAVKR